MDIYMIRTRVGYESSETDPVEAVFLNEKLAERCCKRWNKKSSQESFRSPYYKESKEICGINKRKERMYRDILNKIEEIV